MIDLSKAKLPQNYTELDQVEKVLTVIPVSKPAKTAFFRIHPDKEYTFEAYILDYERSTYLTNPTVAAMFPELVKPVRLVAAVTREGNPYLWPLRLPKEDGRSDNWATSALEIAELAKEFWVRMSASMSAGCYQVVKAPGILVEPNWPDLSMEDWIQKAFKDFYIEDGEHKIVRELLGENTHGDATL